MSYVTGRILTRNFATAEGPPRKYPALLLLGEQSIVLQLHPRLAIRLSETCGRKGRDQDFIVWFSHRDYPKLYSGNIPWLVREIISPVRVRLEQNSTPWATAVKDLPASISKLYPGRGCWTPCRKKDESLLCPRRLGVRLLDADIGQLSHYGPDTDGSALALFSRSRGLTVNLSFGKGDGRVLSINPSFPWGGFYMVKAGRPAVTSSAIVSYKSPHMDLSRVDLEFSTFET